MGDNKPKKNSSGDSEKHKAKLARDAANRPIPAAKPDGQAKKKK